MLLIMAMFFYCLDFFFRISPSLVVGPLGTQYQTNALGIGSLSSAFYLGYTFFQIPAGIILDRINLRPVFVAANLLCTLFFILFISSHHLTVGLIARFILGASSAFSFIGVLFIAESYLPEQCFTLIAGIAISLGTLTASTLQIGSAWLMHWLNWQQTFLYFSFFGLFLAFLFLMPLYSHINLIHKKRNTENNSFHLLKQGAYLLTQKSFVLNGIVGSLFYLPTSLFAGLWGISFLEYTYNVETTRAAFYIMLLFLGWGIGSPLIGLFAGQIKKGHHHWMTLLSLLAMFSSILLIYYPNKINPLLSPLCFSFGLLSSGQVLVWENYSKWASQSFSGIGIALTNTLIMLNGMLFHLLVGSLMDFSHQQTTGTVSLLGFNYHLGLSVIPASFFIAALLAQWALPNKERTRNNLGI